MKQLYTILFIAISFYANAHKDVSGQLLDSQTQEPLIGANILIKNTSRGTVTNSLGKFFLEDVNEKDTLLVSFLGYERLNLPVNSLNTEKIFIKEENVSLAQVVVGNKPTTNLNTISKIDIKLRPAKSSQDVLRIVPGLFIAQHAGGGKAEQIFLRGFDIDHGTDLKISVDGMPVNMVSHAHGQGYSDLHFLIPELIQQVDFGKGPYNAEHGNFATAGYVSFNTKNRLNRNNIKLEAGRFNTFRTLAMLNLDLNSKTENAFIAADYNRTDGPFISNQNFNRINVFGKYNNRITDNTLLSFQVSTFSSRWDASGQIPERAVKQGLIDRFGAIDDTEGGKTSRTNLSIKLLQQVNNQSTWENQFYYSKYDFELFSNFTFFLEDSINGDQIKQKETRDIIGYNTKYTNSKTIGKNTYNTLIGAGIRADFVRNNELSRTKNKIEILEQLAFGDVNENNLFAYAEESIERGRFVYTLGARIDYFSFEYLNKLENTEGSKTESQLIVSPKLNVLYNATEELQLYAKAGVGFHSNDSRVVVAQQGQRTLPKAYGTDLGLNFKPTDKLFINTALWYLYLEQEFVYVGDAGIVEPSGRTRRMGVDLSARYQLTSWLFADADVNYTLARSIDDPEGENYIPLAPDLTSIGGLSFQHKSGINGSIRYRYIKDRAANEDNSVVAKGYTVLDMVLNYTQKKYELGISVENLLNTEWREAQFDTESRLQNEAEPVSEIHYTPGTPFFIKAGITLFF